MLLVRDLTKDLLSQFKSLIPLLTFSFLPVLVILIITASVSAYFDIPIKDFTRDPVAVLNGRPFTGVISNIGILFWCSTSAICLFCAATLKLKHEFFTAKFFAASGSLTLCLLLDDFFLLHEEVLPNYLHISEKLIYFGYLICTLAGAIVFKELIQKTDYLLLLMAFGLFAVSMAADLILPQRGLWYLLEDGFKLLGVVAWFVYFTRTCFIKIQQLE